MPRVGCWACNRSIFLFFFKNETNLLPIIFQFFCLFFPLKRFFSEISPLNDGFISHLRLFSRSHCCCSILFQFMAAIVFIVYYLTFAYFLFRYATHLFLRCHITPVFLSLVITSHLFLFPLPFPPFASHHSYSPSTSPSLFEPLD